MGEATQSSASNRDWQVRCYDAADQVAVCVIDSDHGAVRVGLDVGEREQFFELRAEQVVKFQTALEATLGMIKDRGSDQAKAVRWEGHCYSRWGALRRCLIEATQQDAVRISRVTARTGKREWFVELRDDQIGEFQAALTEAMKVFHTDVAIHGEHWADEETEVVSPCGEDETAFARKINKMVAADAPPVFALVAEIGDRVDAMTIGYCIKFPDHAEVISDCPDHVRGSFSSVERACKLLSAGGKSKIRSVSVAEAQKQVKAACSTQSDSTHQSSGLPSVGTTGASLADSNQ